MVNSEEVLRRLRISLKHHRQRDADQLDTARRVAAWLRWLDLPSAGWRVHIRDDAISIFDGRQFHPLEQPRHAHHYRRPRHDNP